MRNLFYFARIVEITVRLLSRNLGWVIIFSLLIGGFSWFYAEAGTMANLSLVRVPVVEYQNTGPDLFVSVAACAGNGYSLNMDIAIGAEGANDTNVYSYTTATAQDGCSTVASWVPSGWFYSAAVNTDDPGGYNSFQWWEYQEATSTEMVIHNPTLDMFLGITIFFAIFWFLVWFFRRPYDTY